MTHQLKHPKHYLLPLIFWLLAGFNQPALADLPAVVVKTWGSMLAVTSSITIR